MKQQEQRDEDVKPTTMVGELRKVPIDWEALDDAFENNAPEVHSYLHIVSGEVLRVVDGIADPEMHSRIVGDASYLRIESVSSREQYRWMERFIQMVEEVELRRPLAEAIDGKGAFRRFKDVLMGHAGERERWFGFRSERLRVFMEAWLAAHAIKAISREDWKQERQRAVLADESVVRQSAPPRRHRTTDTVKWQIREVIDGLGLRDLDKVLAFTEFIKSKQLARASRPADGSADAAASESVSAPAQDGDSGPAAGVREEGPSSESRRLAAL